MFGHPLRRAGRGRATFFYTLWVVFRGLRVGQFGWTLLPLVLGELFGFLSGIRHLRNGFVVELAAGFGAELFVAAALLGGEVLAA